MIQFCQGPFEGHLLYADSICEKYSAHTLSLSWNLISDQYEPGGLKGADDPYIQMNSK